MYRFDEQRLAKPPAARGRRSYPNGLEVTHSTQDVIRAGGERPQEELEQDPSDLRSAAGSASSGRWARLVDPRSRRRSADYVRRDDIGVDAFKAVWKKWILETTSGCRG